MAVQITLNGVTYSGIDTISIGGNSFVLSESGGGGGDSGSTIDYTLDPLVGVNVVSGKTINGHTGAEESASGEHLSDTFVFQGTVYHWTSKTHYNKLFIYDDQDRYIGARELQSPGTSTYFCVPDGYKGRMKCYEESAPSSAADMATLIPVDNRDGALNSVTINLSEFNDASIWAYNSNLRTFEASLSHFPSLSYISSANVVSTNALLLIDDHNIIASDNSFCFAVAHISGGLVFVGNCGCTTVSDFVQYLVSNNVQIVING